MNILPQHNQKFIQQRFSEEQVPPKKNIPSSPITKGIQPQVPVDSY